jgi:hypothetical protein
MARRFQLIGQVPDAADGKTRLGRESWLRWPRLASASVYMLGNPVGEDKTGGAHFRICGNLVQPLELAFGEIISSHRRSPPPWG